MFKEFYFSMTNEQKEKFAHDVNSSSQYLMLIAYGHKPAGKKLCRKINEVTYGLISEKSLRPDIFGE